MNAGGGRVGLGRAAEGFDNKGNRRAGLETVDRGRCGGAGERRYERLGRAADAVGAEAGGADYDIDGRGNFTLGIKEILIFPEVDIDKLDKVPGMNICIETSAATDEEGRSLLEKLGLPFRRA